MNKLNISYLFLGDCYHDSDDIDTALEFFQKANIQATSLKAKYQGNAELDSTYALSNEKMGKVYAGLGDRERAERYYKNYLAIADERTSADPDNLIFQQNRLTALLDLGMLYYEGEENEKSMDYFSRCYQAAIRLTHAVPDYGEFKRMLAIVYQYRAMISGDAGRLEEAEINYIEMYNCLMELTRLFPDNPAFKDDLAFTCAKIGFFFDDIGKGQRAIRYFKDASRLWHELMEAFPSIGEYGEKADGVDSELAKLRT